MDSFYALGLGYLLGSVPFGLILTRLSGAGDLREIIKRSARILNVDIEEAGAEEIASRARGSILTRQDNVAMRHLGAGYWAGKFRRGNSPLQSAPRSVQVQRTEPDRATARQRPWRGLFLVRRWKRSR